MPITLPKGYSQVLDEVYKAASVSQVLDSGMEGLRETVNVNEFLYPHMSIGGLGDYDRAGGYAANQGVTLEWKTATADYDRGTKINVDYVDNQETFDLAFGKSVGILMREHVAPEADAWTFAKLAGKTGITKDAGDIADGEALLKKILEACSRMDENEVPDDQRYLFITPTLLNSVKALDTTKSREALDGFAATIKVPQSRFVTAIDLLDGKTTGEEIGGWKKSATAKNIHFMIVHKPAVIKYDKHVAGPTVIAPEANPNSDAYIVKYRKYGLLDVYENKLAGIYMHTEA